MATGDQIKALLTSHLEGDEERFFSAALQVAGARPMQKEIGNLMREGEVAEQAGQPTAESAPSIALRPSDVGVWLFRRGAGNQGSTIQEIPFDRSEGVEPPELLGMVQDVGRASRGQQPIPLDQGVTM